MVLFYAYSPKDSLVLRFFSWVEVEQDVTEYILFILMK